MEGPPDPQSPQPSPDLGTPQRSQRFQVGDRVQIFQGTGPGVPGKKTIQFIGTKTRQKALMHNLVVVHYTLCTVL